MCAGSSIITARYIRTGLGVSTSDKEFDNMIHSILYKKVNQSQLINEITNMVVSNKVESVVTYNYDDLIEIELSKKVFLIFLFLGVIGLCMENFLYIMCTV